MRLRALWKLGPTCYHSTTINPKRLCPTWQTVNPAGKWGADNQSPTTSYITIISILVTPSSFSSNFFLDLGFTYLTACWIFLPEFQITSFQDGPNRIPNFLALPYTLSLTSLPLPANHMTLHVALYQCLDSLTVYCSVYFPIALRTPDIRFKFCQIIFVLVYISLINRVFYVLADPL